VYAEALPVAAPAKRNGKDRKSSKVPEGDGSGHKRKRAGGQKDDTPRAFKRIMAFSQGKKFRSGLDDGTDPKQSENQAKPASAAQPEEKPELPTIRPGERLGDFAARVDAELPLAGLLNKTGKTGKDPLGIKVQRTRKERKMHRLYDQWREEERKLQEKREEEKDLAEERALEDENLGVSWPASRPSRKRGGKSGSKGAAGMDDMWEELRRKRAEAKVGLHDIAKAPPELHRGSLVKHKVLDGAKVEVGSVPKAAGSIRRREELAKVRDQVVESYRSLVDAKRPAA
jgi:hypothetical protein